MGTRSLAVPLLALLLASAASAQDAAVTILSPVDGAKLDAKAQNKITYDVVPGPKGDHVHVYVDEGQVALVRQLKGSYTFESLAPGAANSASRWSTRTTPPLASRSASR
jgi:hypothetical protein